MAKDQGIEAGAGAKDESANGNLTLAGLAPIQQLRAHEYVAEQIRRLISLRLLRKGATLPPERDLAALFGVGRATIQAAVRLLEADHLVEARRGRTGGTFVIAPSDDGIAKDYLLARLRRGSDACLEALAFRDLVEPQAAALAASQRTKVEMKTISAASSASEDAKDDPAFMASDTELHLAIASASHNKFLYSAIEQSRIVLSDALAALPDSELWRGRSISDHTEIVAAVKSRDATRAEEAMRAHIASTEKSIKALLKSL